MYKSLFGGGPPPRPPADGLALVILVVLVFWLFLADPNTKVPEGPARVWGSPEIDCAIIV